MGVTGYAVASRQGRLGSSATLGWFALLLPPLAVAGVTHALAKEEPVPSSDTGITIVKPHPISPEEQLFAIVSSIDDDKKAALLDDVQAMVRSFKLAVPAPAVRGGR